MWGISQMVELQGRGTALCPPEVCPMSFSMTYAMFCYVLFSHSGSIIVCVMLAAGLNTAVFKFELPQM